MATTMSASRGAIPVASTAALLLEPSPPRNGYVSEGNKAAALPVENRVVAEQSVYTHVDGELRRYDTCGIACFGFGWARCAWCAQGFVVAFSCKCCSVRSSCNGRRMPQPTPPLGDRVFALVPISQWMIAVPKRLRCFLTDRQNAVAALTQTLIARSERLLCAAAGVTSDANTPTVAVRDSAPSPFCTASDRRSITTFTCTRARQTAS